MKSSNWFNRKMKIVLHLFIILIVLIPQYIAYGKEWTEEQDEVWAVILTAWEDLKKGDVQSLMASRHEKCLSLYSNNPYAFDNDQFEKTTKNWVLGDHKPTSIKVEPIEIIVAENVAIIFYLFKWENDIGSKQKGRNMSTLIKQNNKWYLIGGMGASCDKPSPCPYAW